jgi:hypothetical protein
MLPQKLRVRSQFVDVGGADNRPGLLEGKGRLGVAVGTGGTHEKNVGLGHDGDSRIDWQNLLDHTSGLAETVLAFHMKHARESRGKLPSRDGKRVLTHGPGSLASTGLGTIFDFPARGRLTGSRTLLVCGCRCKALAKETTKRPGNW